MLRADSAEMAEAVISIVVPTCNRAERLARLLDSLGRLDPPRSGCDIIVVDNGAGDRTPDVVADFAARSPFPVTYLVESRAGVAYARNAGTSASSGSIVAFTDDDQEVAPDWLHVIERTFADETDPQVIGGRVLPSWSDVEPPAPIAEQWGPLSIIDRGQEPFRLSRSRWMCLPGGNMAWRRATLLALGGFSVQYPRTEDRELLVRFLLLGEGAAMYVPALVVLHHLDRHRLNRAFLRAWNSLEGRMRAGYAFEELFDKDGRLRPPPPNTPRVLGVSRYIYREWLRTLHQYARAQMSGSEAGVLRHEGRLLLLSAYIRRRIELTAGAPGATLFHRASATAARGAAHAAASFGLFG
jgi:glycosyltransferase involved in cell wall biosynthesis